jgi:hypothetical protein
MNTPPVLSLPAGSDTYLVEAYRVLDGVWSPIEFDRPDAVRIQLFDSQWLLPNASLALPMHRGSSCLWIFASSNRQEHAEVAVTESTNTLGNITIAPEWRWIPLHLDLDENRKGTAAWVKMKTSNPHRPDIRGFPNTLGFRLGTVMVLPDPNFLQSEP